MKSIVAALVCCLAGCQSVSLRSSDEEPQSIVNRRVVGMSVGDFIERYGKPMSREEEVGGALSFNWQSARVSQVGGPYGPLISACRLRLSADRNARIVTATIVRDGDGQKRLSGCAEVFAEN